MKIVLVSWVWIFRRLKFQYWRATTELSDRLLWSFMMPIASFRWIFYENESATANSAWRLFRRKMFIKMSNQRKDAHVNMNIKIMNSKHSIKIILQIPEDTKLIIEIYFPQPPPTSPAPSPQIFKFQGCNHHTQPKPTDLITLSNSCSAQIKHKIDSK